MRSLRNFALMTGIAVELKSVSALNEIHDAQLRSYCRSGDYGLGPMIYLNVQLLRQDVRRLVN